jgi:hypothetical protein
VDICPRIRLLLRRRNRFDRRFIGFIERLFILLLFGRRRFVAFEVRAYWGICAKAAPVNKAIIAPACMVFLNTPRCSVDSVCRNLGMVG